MNPLSSVVGSHNHGFTPRSVIALRGLSIQRPRQHQREIPARQVLKQGSEAIGALLQMRTAS